MRISIENVISNAISGIITFSSSCPACDAYATAVSAPMMWNSTWFMHSSIDGFTLPGMIEEPGCTAGSVISARPVCGPDAKSRRSFVMRVSSSARLRSAAETATTGSCDCIASLRSGADSTVTISLR